MKSAASSSGRCASRSSWPPAKSLIAAALGGLIMGWRAGLGFGCNIGAFVGGAASGSLHGWVWFAAALGGSLIVTVIAVVVIVGNHLTTPSSGRAVSPEDFAGACASCGAPCPSVKK